MQGNILSRKLPWDSICRKDQVEVAMEAIHSVPRPDDEAARLRALRRYLELDTLAEKDFALLARVATEICNVPYALITFVEEDLVRTFSSVGMPDMLIPRDDAACAWTILQDGVLEITDLKNDRKTSHSQVMADTGMQLYAGTSLVTGEGYRIGTLCVWDKQPRRLNAQQRELLTGLARQAMALLELRENESLLTQALLRAQRLASVDMLTGLLNRRVLYERLAHEIERSRRYGTPLSLIMIDLDNFKMINDRLGHAAGDCVLRSVGEIISTGSRASDIAGRYGGEELCVVLPQTSTEGARVFAESLRDQIAGAAIALGEQMIKVTASFGVAALEDGQTTLEQLLAAADVALYSAKRNGRNRVVLAGATPPATPERAAMPPDAGPPG